MICIRSILFILPHSLTYPVAHRTAGWGEFIARLTNLRFYLRMLDSELTQGEYVMTSLLNALAWAALLFVPVLFAASTRDAYNGSPLRVALIPSVAAFVLMFFVFLVYPRIRARKRAESEDKELVFALKDLLVQIGSGVSLFEAMKNVANAQYGTVSQEFRTAVQDINAGESQEKALERMAVRSESEFIKKTVWELVVVLRSGASLQGALRDLVENLRSYQRNQIRSYTQEMNLWVLLYVVVAIAIPSLGATLIVILSSFSTVNVREPVFIALVFVCFMAEIILLEYIKVRRPLLY
ncbi:MAG: type II secretion system F family protein [Candidatus Micrarchaeota archaeon]|nr:type II secretion system F family protein [Candidatus Micrarchaeota archaeon]